LLFGVTAFDLATWATVPLVLGAMSLLAPWVPARRAMRVGPVTAVREERVSGGRGRLKLWGLVTGSRGRKHILPIIAALLSVGCATSDDATPDTLATDTMQQSRSGETSDARISSFRAVGQEPGWLLTIDDSLRLQWDYDARQLTVATPRVQVSNG